MLFTEDKIRRRGQREGIQFSKSADQLLVEFSQQLSITPHSYDIFLSHSSLDAELILGMKGTLNDLGYSVYVDWIEDKQLDRKSVTPSTAELLRNRMKSSKSLLFVTTDNSPLSRWMPWECGYFDGLKGKVAIAPIKKFSTDNVFMGQEYLGIYPYVVQEKKWSYVDTLWIHTTSKRYINYATWVSTPNSQVKWMIG